MADLAHHLTSSWSMAGAVVVTTVVMYLLLVAVLRTWGPRLLADPSPRSLAAVAVLGAIVGRTTLGPEPTLEGGVLALATLLVLTAVTGVALRGGVRGRAEVLVVDGQLRTDVLARLRLSEDEVWVRVRESGRASLDDVALAVLEPTGRISVIARGAPIDPRAVAGVHGLPPG